MTDQEIAGTTATQITTAHSCCQDGRRSPAKVARLLSYLRKAGGYQGALEWLAERDSDLHQAACIVSQQVSGNPRKEDAIWREVLATLDNFADQAGNAALMDVNQASKALSEVVGTMWKSGRIEPRKKKKYGY